MSNETMSFGEVAENFNAETEIGQYPPRFSWVVRSSESELGSYGAEAVSSQLKPRIEAPIHYVVADVS